MLFEALRVCGYSRAVSPAAIFNFMVELFHVIRLSSDVFVTVTVAVPVTGKASVTVTAYLSESV